MDLDIVANALRKFRENRGLTIGSLLLGAALGAGGMWIGGFLGELGRHRAELMNEPRTAAALLSSQEFFETVRKLQGKFLLLKEYNQAVVGRSISWEGRVLNVIESEAPFPHKAHLLVVLAIGEGSSQAGIAVSFPKEFAMKIYAFQSGDTVRVAGTIDHSEGSYVSVVGHAIELVAGKQDSSTK